LSEFFKFNPTSDVLLAWSRMVKTKHSGKTQVLPTIVWRLNTIE